MFDFLWPSTIETVMVDLFLSLDHLTLVIASMESVIG
jgi:hypothetical protein